MSDARTLRDRIGPAVADRDRLAGGHPSRSAARMLVQVYGGGAMPTGPDHVYFTHPVDLDGSETEGGAASPTVDTSRTVPVVVLWGTPSAGDILTAYAVGGRWVSEIGGMGGGGGYLCGGCSVPRSNLTISWTNIIGGNGSATLVYTSSPATLWVTGCTNELIFELLCTDNVLEFRVYYFLSGSCPTGESAYCSTSGGSPGLVITSFTCSPFLLVMTVSPTNCPNLSADGYASFTVSL